MTTYEMVQIVSKLSSIDIALDILLASKQTPYIKLKFNNDKLLLK